MTFVRLFRHRQRHNSRNACRDKRCIVAFIVALAVDKRACIDWSGQLPGGNSDHSRRTNYA